MASWRWIWSLWAPALFLTCLTVYLLTLSPCFLDDDSSETVTAGFTLGLQHPPCYPVDALFVRLLGFIPIGGACFRVNLGSALLAALGALLLAWNILLVLRNFFARETAPQEGPKDGVPIACAVAGAFWLAFSKTYWEKALGAKGGLYVLETVLVLALLRCLIGHEILSQRANPGTAPSPRWRHLAFFIFGVGLAHYWQTQLLFIPAVAIFFLLRPEIRQPKSWVKGACFCALGLSPFLVLPLRAHLHPDLNLGAPDTYSNFMAALLRKYFAFREPGLPTAFLRALTGTSSWHSFAGLWHVILDFQNRRIPTHFVRDMKWTALALALWGCFTWWRTGERRILALILIPLACLLAALYSGLWLVVNPHLLWYIDNYLLPANWMVAFLAAIGLFSLWDSSQAASRRPEPPASRSVKILFVLVVLAVPFRLLTSNFPKNDQEKQLARYDYGENLLKSAPRNSVLFAEADEDYFPLYYFQNVERKRPDIVMIPSFTLFETWGVEQVERKHPELGLTASALDFPDHFARAIYSFSQIVRNNRDQRACAFSLFDGAFHRFYVVRHPALLARTSGVLLELDSPLASKTTALDLSQLRLRYLRELKANTHDSMRGIVAVYQKLGVGP